MDIRDGPRAPNEMVRLRVINFKRSSFLRNATRFVTRPVETFDSQHRDVPALPLIWRFTVQPGSWLEPGVRLATMSIDIFPSGGGYVLW